MIQFELPQNNASIIKVIGVGGGGGNAVNYMYGLGIEGVDFIVCNTDKKALHNSTVPTKIQLGPSLTQGLGAGANPEIGMLACEESIAEIESLLVNNTKMVFVTAGMGGGTGTGGAPIVAKVAKDLGILTVGIITTPFSYEGKRRMRQAEEGIAKMRENVDTILVISNDKLRHQFGNIPTSQAFCKADDILATATKCITDVINSQGHIVVDFADVSTVMRDGGVAILGSAIAKGEGRAYEAVEKAINSPLLNDNNINGAKWVLLNINSAHGVHEHTLDEVEMIQAYVQEMAGDDCDVIFGTGFDDNLEDNISVTVIATGFDYTSTNNAYKTDFKKPKADKDKVVYTLHEEQPADPQLFENLASHTQPQPTANIEMVEIEPPAIPNRLAFGLGRFHITKAPVVNNPIPSAQTEEKVIFNLEETNEINIQPVAELPIVETSSIPLVEEPANTWPENRVVFELDATTPEMPVNEISVNETVSNEIILNQTIELVTESVNPIQEEIDKLFSESPVNESIQMVEKTAQEMQDDYVTIKGITLNRRKGSRLLTDMELEAEANFELQKRALEERASKLRSMSFNVNKADIDDHEHNIPAYQRRNIALENHGNSAEDTYSSVRVTDGNGGNNISTLNSFLNGKNPD
ncbi:MAG: cell division protein FtsZ [Bacteroidetes bacterium]|nr:cell division protein FtsZ [Bacteroidota bacterium]